MRHYLATIKTGVSDGTQEWCIVYGIRGILAPGK